MTESEEYHRSEMDKYKAMCLAMKIGETFILGGGTFLVTDIGTRTIIGVKISDDKLTDETEIAKAKEHVGYAPFYIVEHVFDEYDFEAIIDHNKERFA